MASNTETYGCGNELAHSGTQFWCDGSVGGYDGLYQTIATTPGTTYNISFWLNDNSDSPVSTDGLDMLTYVGDRSAHIGPRRLRHRRHLLIRRSALREPSSVVDARRGSRGSAVGVHTSKKRLQHLA